MSMSGTNSVPSHVAKQLINLWSPWNSGIFSGL